MTGRCEYNVCHVTAIGTRWWYCDLQKDHQGLHVAKLDGDVDGVFIWRDDRCLSQNGIGTRCNLKRGHTGWHSGDNRYGNGVEGWE